MNAFVMRRELVVASFVSITLGVALPAEADIAPPGPARPSWDDTPLPMPEDPAPDPSELVLLGALGVLGLGAARLRRTLERRGV